jgi:hypothetical protein
MAILTVRGLDEQTSKALKRTAEKNGTSVNSFVVQVIRESLGLDKKKLYGDLDALFGTWSDKEYKEFERNTSAFERIEENLWKP